MSDVEFMDNDNSALPLRISENITLYKPSLLVRLGIVRNEKTSLTIYLVSAIILAVITAILLYWQLYRGRNEVMYREDIPTRIREKMSKEMYENIPSKFSQ